MQDQTWTPVEYFIQAVGPICPSKVKQRVMPEVQPELVQKEHPSTQLQKKQVEDSTWTQGAWWQRDNLPLHVPGNTCLQAGEAFLGLFAVL